MTAFTNPERKNFLLGLLTGVVLAVVAYFIGVALAQ